jgi:PilZ domain-containing protein
MQDRRSEPRYTVREGALVWDLSRIKAGFQEATIVDLSRNGIRLVANREFATGTQVAIDFRGMVICGSVQYCAPSENRFAAGIRIGGVLDQVSEDYVAKDAA